MRRHFPTIILLMLICAVAHGNEKDRSATDLLRPGWYVQTDLYVQYNSLAVLGVFEASYNLPLREKMNMVWSHVEGGPHLTVNPSATSIGVHGEWMPVALFKLEVLYDYLIFHGAFGALTEFDAVDAPHDEDDMSRSSLGKFGTAHRLVISPVLQALYRGVLLRNENQLTLYGANTEAPYWFNWDIESLSEPNDFVFGERISIMYDILVRHESRMLFAGPSYSLTWQPSTHFRRQRVGVDFYAEPFDTRNKVVPHFMLITGFNLEETYRKHEFVVIVNAGINIDRRRTR